ncbi:copper chaperone PCu(A)C [Nonomuraea gerenzanensis]|uniref:Copper metallochaperone, bacterial analog of Cox17 protein n=1 Tax=Nonomuraea gerenzanensis TaxID=93944 RepID=A0A1M4DX93_9ACTN|nr:copper chaperone PCu(A)C [Nonomuraea gerenzanensis]UBU13506.1 copper chaperone PCu(A)C [Nonomuraea gerenzanensis]SBO91167.1 Copper metallochaperone, bacterial analog of Cox17 protein [Nonomuraea gerenzanensis]
MYVRHALVLASAVVALTACGGTASPEPAPTTSASAAAAPSSAQSPAQSPATALTITDPWVKTTEKGMTAAFGTLVNNTDAPVTITSGTSPLSPTIELHEVVEDGGKMVMRPKQGGFVVPARGTHRLQPGGDHIMLMGVTEEVLPGARIPFTLQVEGGEPLEFTAIGKDFAGGEEDYQPGHK